MRSAKPARPRSSRPGLERLEDRAVPATITWDGGPGGNGTNWLDPVNWRDAGGNDVLPGPYDDVVLNSTGTNPTIMLGGNTIALSVTCNRNLQVTGSQTYFSIGPGASTN